MRAIGKVLFDDTLTKHSVVEDAKRRQQQKQRQLQEQRAARAERPVPNYVAYSFLFPNYDPSTGKGAPSPLPKCKVCRVAVLHPKEHHVCEGYKPQFEDADKVRERWEAKREERRERWEQQREMIREAKANGMFYDEGNEDEPEEDYCEGDDDGWECEDDGDPMWD